MKQGLILLMLLGTVLVFVSGCDFKVPETKETRTITDQLGRTLTIPVRVKKIAALHHFGGKIVYALNQQHRLVEKSIYGREALALGRVDKTFSALPSQIQSHGYNVEGLISLNPEIIFAYTSMNPSEMEQFKNSGIPVIAVKGETFEESFDAVRIMADILECKEKGEQYINSCQHLLDMVADRLKSRKTPGIRVMFTGPKSIFSVATGNMLQSQILERSGAENVALELNGFWAEVSPEQIAQWNPDVIFLGSYLEENGKDRIYQNPQFQTIKAIRNRAVYQFPANIGWWDYPAPHCVLGVVWSAKTLYPALFSDIDMMALANQFYTTHMGYSFEQMGGMLE